MSRLYTSYEIARILTTIFDYSDNNMKDLKDTMDSLIEKDYFQLSDKDKQSILNIENFLNNYEYPESED